MSPLQLARRLALVLLLLALLVSARPRPVARPDILGDAPPEDVLSVAEPSKIRTTHLALDLDVDFETRTIRGTATHTITKLRSTSTFALDVRDLDIETVTADGEPAAWRIDPAGNSGDALVIDVGPATRTVRIDYETRPSSTALHWLTPAQTSGDVAPFLYTLTEPIDARSWIPVQDTPAVRMTWEATVTLPGNLLALMSAPNPTTINPAGRYAFAMTTPVPAYLIALAAGRLEFHDLGNRTGFYAEPEVVADASWDLQWLPAMFDVAQRVVAPYPWPRYDLLLAPPGFLVGGMEYPHLNFINSASVASGNRDPVVPPSSLIAHELAHTWAGDLVTCATWSDTWLNEGFATYLENRILGELAGSEREEYSFFQDRRNFEAFVEDAGVESPETTLHRVPHPGFESAIFNSASYEKGGLFLKMIEDNAGREEFDAFLREYLARYEGRWVDDEAFLVALRATVVSGQPELESRLDLETWLYGIGLPASVTAPVTSAIYERVAAQARAFRGGASASSLNTAGWTSLERNLFLAQISDLVAPRIREIDAAFGMAQRKTAPLDWWISAVAVRYQPAMANFDAFMIRGSWSVVYVYTWLARTPENLTFARGLYSRARPHYVPELQGVIDAILDVNAAALRVAA
ncbi:MAG: M1 family aminopeptidase/hydrolase [Thermoanaerobaculia bacterium]